MKKLLLTTTLALALTAPMVSAAPLTTSIYIDASGAGAVSTGSYDLITDVFNTFTTDQFSPLSTYIDTNDNNAIETGDKVRDTATDIEIGSLNPLGNVTESGGFGTDWGINISWIFEGTALVGPSPYAPNDVNYSGNFDSGTISFDITDANGGLLANDALVLDFVANTGIPLPNDSAYVEFFASVSSATAGIFFTNDGIDFNTMIGNSMAVDVAAWGVLDNLNNTPMITGNQENGHDVYERNTSAVKFSVGVIPEPTSLAIMGLGLLGFAAARKRKN